MNVLSLESVSKTLKDEPLFQDVSFGLEEGDHVALIGRNGEGKSTFLKILAGLVVPDSGTIAMKNGTDLVMLEQGVQFREKETVSSYLLQGGGLRIATWNAYQHALAHPEDEANLIRQSELMENHDVWNLQSDYTSLLGELGLYDLLDSPMVTLSGGMQKRWLSQGCSHPARPCCFSMNRPTTSTSKPSSGWNPT